MWFVTLSTMKSLDDHCGYKLPWDPFQWLGEQDTEFHDVHHQSWGIKVRLLLAVFSIQVLGFQRGLREVGAVRRGGVEVLELKMEG